MKNGKQIMKLKTDINNYDFAVHKNISDEYYVDEMLWTESSYDVIQYYQLQLWLVLAITFYLK